MIRLPPRSTLTDTLFPYTTLFRSAYSCRGSATNPHRRPSTTPFRRAAARPKPQRQLFLSPWDRRTAMERLGLVDVPHPEKSHAFAPADCAASIAPMQQLASDRKSTRLNSSH